MLSMTLQISSQMCKIPCILNALLHSYKLGLVVTKYQYVYRSVFMAEMKGITLTVYKKNLVENLYRILIFAPDNHVFRPGSCGERALKTFGRVK